MDCESYPKHPPPSTTTNHPLAAPSNIGPSHLRLTHAHTLPPSQPFEEVFTALLQDGAASAALLAPLNALAAHAFVRLDAARGELRERVQEIARGGGIGARTWALEAAADFVELAPLVLLLK